MNKLRDSVHSANQVWLREVFIARRQELGLSQRALAEKIGVIYSLIGKIETGDRRLDVVEFILYCQALELDARLIIQQLSENMEVHKG
jgi:transcriptional regulator with XRE-family HTH domain